MHGRATLSWPMKLPEPFSWTREEARSGKFDGKFLIGVRTTGIYCLPSCPTHPPKKENVTLYRTEAECQAAGLRACKRCRPDLFYRGEDENIALFEGLAARVRANPAGFRATPPALAQGRRRQPDQAGRLVPGTCASGAGPMAAARAGAPCRRTAAHRQRQGGGCRLSPPASKASRSFTASSWRSPA